MSASFDRLISFVVLVVPEGPWRLFALGVMGTWGFWLVLTVAERCAAGWTGGARRPSELAAGLTVAATLQALKQRLERLQGTREPRTIEILEEILGASLVVESSDIHISPVSQGYLLTFRVDGTLHEAHRLTTAAGQALVNRVKVLAKLDLHVRSIPQDGRLVTSVRGTSVEARVSTLPTEGGERVVLRLVAGVRGVPSLPKLNLSPEREVQLSSLLARPQGLLVVTGPVGSGKSTTLYASLSHIATTRASTSTLVTLEDPVELRLPFATQTQINARTGMTFATTLRSVLRQDPNVLMVGEIRDRETADIALQAGLSGHLILTTIHSNSAAGAFARLVEMGLAPHLLASSIIGILSQRLVRTLCPVCRHPKPLSFTQRDRFAQQGVELGDRTYYEAPGCPDCDHQGFVGRTPIVELLMVGPEVQKGILERLPTDQLRNLAISAGLVPLVEDGLRVAGTGQTSLSEILRVTE